MRLVLFVPFVKSSGLRLAEEKLMLGRLVSTCGESLIDVRERLAMSTLCDKYRRLLLLSRRLASKIVGSPTRYTCVSISHCVNLA